MKARHLTKLSCRLHFISRHFYNYNPGYDAARITGLNICATLKSELGDLDKVKRIVKLVGVVNCTDTFAQHPAVLNGCSDLLVEIFGEKGRHSRTDVGKNVLPLGTPVEIEAVVEVESD